MLAIAAFVGAQYIEEKVTTAVQVAGKAAGDFVIAVQEGADNLKDNAKAAAAETFGTNGRNRGLVTAVEERQKVRWLGLPGRAAATMTPEKIEELRQLAEAKKEIMERVASLDEEIENLRGSIFRALYHSKIATKVIKKEELEAIHKSKSWDELQEKVAAALTKDKVITGRHSRTQALLVTLSKSKTHLSTPVAT